MEAYDPSRSPVPQVWLALTEFKRIELVEAFHERSGDFGGSLKLHSMIHTVVENQLAMAHPAEAGEALSRLMRQGLDRHEAIHAIGTVLAEHLFPILKAKENRLSSTRPVTVRAAQCKSCLLA